MTFPYTEQGFDRAQAYLNSSPHLASSGPQCMSDEFAKVPQDMLVLLNERCATEPRLSVRLYSSFDQKGCCDLAGFELLPNLRHLKIHYGVPRVINENALRSLTKLRSTELEIVEDFDTSFIGAWRNLEELSIIRDSKRASAKPDFNILGDLPNLKKLYCLGYVKWQDGVKRSTSLRHMALQQLKVKNWDFLPAHKLDFLELHTVQGPEVFQKEQLAARCEELKLVRMEKALGFDAKRLFSDFIRHSETQYSISVQADDLSFAASVMKNGHDWAREFTRLSPLPKGIDLEPEADMVAICGAKTGLSNYRRNLIKALAKAYV